MCVCGVVVVLLLLLLCSSSSASKKNRLAGCNAGTTTTSRQMSSSYHYKIALPVDCSTARAANRAVWKELLRRRTPGVKVKQPEAEAILSFGNRHVNRTNPLSARGWRLLVSVGRDDDFDNAIDVLHEKIVSDNDLDGNADKASYLAQLGQMSCEDFKIGGIVGAVFFHGSMLPPHRFGWKYEPGMAFSRRLPTNKTCVGAPWRDIRKHSWSVGRRIKFANVVPLKGRFAKTLLLDELELYSPAQEA